MNIINKTLKNKYYKVLSEQDFYPFPDNRIINTNIEQIYINEFQYFCNYYFRYLNSQGYYDENIYRIR